MKVEDVVKELEIKIEAAKRFASDGDTWNFCGVLLEMNNFLTKIIKEVDVKDG